MERLFETVLGRRIRRECQTLAECKLSVALQGPQTNLAASGFQLRPDISITHGDGVPLSVKSFEHPLEPKVLCTKPFSQ